MNCPLKLQTYTVPFGYSFSSRSPISESENAPVNDPSCDNVNVVLHPPAPLLKIMSIGYVPGRADTASACNSAVEVPSSVAPASSSEEAASVVCVSVLASVLAASVVCASIPASVLAASVACASVFSVVASVDTSVVPLFFSVDSEPAPLHPASKLTANVAASATVIIFPDLVLFFLIPYNPPAFICKYVSGILIVNLITMLFFGCFSNIQSICPLSDFVSLIILYRCCISFTIVTVL